MPALAKILRPAMRFKLLYLLDDEGLYFIKSKYYPFITRLFSRLALKLGDGYLCIGKFQRDLLLEILNEKEPNVHISFNGIEMSRFQLLRKNEPDLNSHNILFIGNGPDGWRIWYKGLDILIKGFKKLVNDFPDSTLTIIGDWDSNIQNKLLSTFNDFQKSRVLFTGPQKNIYNFLKDKSLYVHIARGEAWGISVTEAMAAGIPALVSSLTGAAEIVAKVSGDLI